MKKNLAFSVALAGIGIILLFINKLLTANSSPDGLYISALRQPATVIAYAILALGVLVLIYGVLKTPRLKDSRGAAKVGK